MFTPKITFLARKFKHLFVKIEKKYLNFRAQNYIFSTKNQTLFVKKRKKIFEFSRKNDMKIVTLPDILMIFQQCVIVDTVFKIIVLYHIKQTTTPFGSCLS